MKNAEKGCCLVGIEEAAAGFAEKAGTSQLLMHVH